MSSQPKKPARKWQQQPVANHASEGNDRAANAQRVETEANGAHAVETGQDRMVIVARAMGNVPAPMENAADAVVSAAVNGAADPASVAAHSIVRSLSSVLTRTATVS